MGIATMIYAEKPEEALAIARKALLLSPRDPAMSIGLHVCALCCFILGRDDEAVEFERRALERPTPQMYRLLAAALGQLGRVEEAREALDEAFRLAPDITLERLRSVNSPRLMERMLEGWRKAGWKD